MIKQIKLIRNVGQYDSVSPGTDTKFSRLTLLYAENGRGKTTICAILRSLATGEALPIAERQRLGAQNPPHVILDCDDSTSTVIFADGKWSRTIAELAVFDDAFVDANVYSGLAIGADHRQNLHELILGARGVALGRQVQKLADEIEVHNRLLRQKATDIPSAAQGSPSVDEFCAMVPRPSIDEEIVAAERKLNAARESEPIRSHGTFQRLSLPSFALEAFEALLARDLPTLETSAARQVQEHVAQQGDGAEQWISSGMRILARDERGNCPFCAQDLGPSQIIRHYRAYFGTEYDGLKRAIATAHSDFNRTHSGDVPAAFERTVRGLVEHRQFWSRFCEVPSVDVDTAAIGRTWRAAREAIAALFERKLGSPLDKVLLPQDLRATIQEYEAHRLEIERKDIALQNANSQIMLVKEQAAAGNITALTTDVTKLKSHKSRFSEQVAKLCDEYLVAKGEKATIEKKRDEARGALDNHRKAAFPGFQDAINRYLSQFNSGFRLDKVTGTNTRGGPTCTYDVLINNLPVAIAGGKLTEGQPSFKNTLSAGDRNTLALAFFFASLDQDPNLATKIVVVDDPVSSLDDHRSLTTVQEIRRLAERSAQVVLLSHAKGFLCKVWDGSDKTSRSAIRIVRKGTSSSIESWDVEQDSITEHDRRHALLRNYVQSAAGSIRDVARSVRPLLEGFLRAACPEHFPPGTLLGPFREKCKQRLRVGDPILESGLIEELGQLTEYANRFHHDSNAAWETEAINEAELQGFAQRALTFAKR